MSVHLLSPGAGAESLNEGITKLSDLSARKFKLRVQRVRDLMRMGMDHWVKWELFEIERHTRNPHYLSVLMAQYEVDRAYNRALNIAQDYFTSQRAALGMDPSILPIWKYTFPQAYPNWVDKYAGDFGVQSDFVWSIMRAESRYRNHTASPVGALGLMQLMPYTARRVAKLDAEEKFASRELFQPKTNIRLGTRYLRRLLGEFAGNIPLAAAAYNAGPQHVNAWLYTFGGLDMDEFIEHIPYLETRHYVKEVVRNYEIYQSLYNSNKTSVVDLATSVPVHITTPPAYRENWDRSPAATGN